MNIYFIVVCHILFYLLFGGFPLLASEYGPQIIVPNDYVTREKFYDSNEMTTIKNILPTEYTGKDSIIIFGQKSWHIVNIKSDFKSEAIKISKVNSVLVRPEIVKLNKSFNIIERGPIADVGLKDLSGNQYWTFNPDPEISIKTMAFGDVDKDGKVEFYVSSSNGIYRLDLNGNQVWRRGNWAYDVKVLKKKIKEKAQIVSVGFDGRNLQFWDCDGDLIHTVKLKIRVYSLETVIWEKSESFIVHSGRSIYLLSNTGEIIFKHSLENEIFLTRAKIIGSKQSFYLAVIAKFRSSSGLAMLCIFDNSGEIFYKELINTTSALQSVGPNREVLLVGNGPGVVYKYTVRNQ